MKHYVKVQQEVVTDRIVFDGDMPDHWPNRSEWVEDEVSQIGWVYNNGTLSPPVTPPPPTTIEDIKNEAQRRIIALVGAPTLDRCFAKQLNALMRASELNAKETWTPAEEAEAAQLQAMADAIKAIRAKSNDLELTLPSDFYNDSHWQ